MPRQQTSAVERTEQNNQLTEQVAAELGKDSVTVRYAQQHRRQEKAIISRIKPRELDLGDAKVVPIGVVLASVQDYKILRGTTAALSLVTNAREFGDVIHDAARISPSGLLVAALFEIPRDLGLEDEDEWGDE